MKETLFVQAIVSFSTKALRWLCKDLNVILNGRRRGECSRRITVPHVASNVWEALDIPFAIDLTWSQT